MAAYITTFQCPETGQEVADILNMNLVLHDKVPPEVRHGLNDVIEHIALEGFLTSAEELVQTIFAVSEEYSKRERSI